ncbi:MAG: ABC transporter permease subunit [Candidatus Hodarchaeales archaeon]
MASIRVELEEIADEATLRRSRIMRILNVIAVPLISIILAIIVGTLILIFMGYNPVNTYYHLIVDTMTPKKIADTLWNATPLILTGLSVAVAFRGGMFNIGTEGQVVFGGFITALFGYGIPYYSELWFNIKIDLPFFIMIPLLLILGMLGGAFWAFLPAILKAKRGVHEVITTIMMNYIALTLMVFFVGDLSAPFIDRNYHGNSSPQTPKISESGKIPTIAETFINTPLKFLVESFRNSKLHWGLLIALLACVIIFIILWRTKLGYETRAVGYNPRAAQYGGISVSKNIIYVMLISGALGGLAGALEVMAYWDRFVYGFSTGLGFDGIAVALIGGNHPFGVIFGGVLFGWLKSGGQVFQLIQIPKDLASTLKGLIVFFVAVPMISKTIITNISPAKLVIFREKMPVGFSTHEMITKYVRLSLIVVVLIFGSIGWLISIDVLGQEVSLFLFMIIIFGVIIFQELQARSTMKQDVAKTLSIGKDSRYDKRNVKIVWILSAILLAQVAIMVVIDSLFVSFPFTRNLFFFDLDNYGKFMALLSIVSLFVYIYIINKLNLPRNHSITYLFFGASIIFGFLAVTTIFELNPALLFTMTLSIATPIGLAALGGMFSEKSGVVNIGLEGMMLTGAFVAVWLSYDTGNPWVGVFGALIAGAMMGMLHAIASIRFRADQVVVGVAINMLASALTTLGIIAVWDVRGTSEVAKGLANINLSFISGIGQQLSSITGIQFFGDFTNFIYLLSGGSTGLSPLVYIFIALIFISWWIIQRTAFGLRVRAVGEHPRAADTLGINVYKIRYICVALSGVLAALGGAQLTLGTAPIFGRNMTTGRGFVALAALIFGGWSPIGAALASLLFAFAYAFRFQLESLGIEWFVNFMNFDWPIQNLTPTIPFLVTIIVVSTVAKRAKPPAADGVPYIKEG